MNDSPRKGLTIAVVFVLLLALYISVYTVREGQRAILLFLGKIVQDKHGEAAVKKPGLHFKLPFLQRVHLFDARLQTIDIDDSRFVTAEKKDVLVNYYVKWRISDFPLYYTSTGGNAVRAETLLEQQLNDGLRAEFGKRTIREVVSSERTDIMRKIQAQADEGAKRLGIDVVDVRIKRIDLPPEVSSSVYARMGAERERIAAEHRAMGKSKAEVIRAAADAQVTIILATGEEEANKIMAEGDATSSRIYGDAYSKDVAFYEFWRSLSAYRSSFNKPQDIFVLRPIGHFFRYFGANDRKTGATDN